MNLFASSPSYSTTILRSRDGLLMKKVFDLAVKTLVCRISERGFSPPCILASTAKIFRMIPIIQGEFHQWYGIASGFFHSPLLFISDHGTYWNGNSQIGVRWRYHAFYRNHFSFSGELRGRKSVPVFFLIRCMRL